MYSEILRKKMKPTALLIALAGAASGKLFRSLTSGANTATKICRGLTTVH